jgi:hypothetical protein
MNQYVPPETVDVVAPQSYTYFEPLDAPDTGFAPVPTKPIENRRASWLDKLLSLFGL